MNIPKNDHKYHWTQHVVRKMMFYGLSADRVKRVIRCPKRMEEGIAPGTVAGMQIGGSGKKPWEIWVMWAEKPTTYNKQLTTGKDSKNSMNSGGALSVVSHKLLVNDFRKKIIITAWKYPGTSPIRDQIPIPADILRELRADGVL